MLYEIKAHPALFYPQSLYFQHLVLTETPTASCKRYLCLLWSETETYIVRRRNSVTADGRKWSSLCSRQRWDCADSGVSGKPHRNQKARAPKPDGHEPRSSAITPGAAPRSAPHAARFWEIPIGFDEPQSHGLWRAAECSLKGRNCPSCSFALLSWLFSVGSKWKPLDWSWSRASSAALFTSSISFNDMKVKCRRLNCRFQILLALQQHKHYLHHSPFIVPSCCHT